MLPSLTLCPLPFLPPPQAFIDENPDLTKISDSKWKFAASSQSDMAKVSEVERLMRYLANLAVNGHPVALGADATKLAAVDAPVAAPAAPTAATAAAVAVVEATATAAATAAAAPVAA